MILGIRRVTLASAAGVGIVVLQAAAVASAAQAASEPAEGGTGGGSAQAAENPASAGGVHRAGYGLAFGVVQSDAASSAAPADRDRRDLPGPGDEELEGLLGSDDDDDEGGKPIQLGGGGKNTSRGTLLGLGKGGEDDPRVRAAGELGRRPATDGPALLSLGNGKGERTERDGVLLELGNGAAGGPSDSGHAGRGGLVWLLNAAGPALRDGKIVDLFNGPPRQPTEAYSVALADKNDDLTGGLVSLGNGENGSDGRNPGPAGDGALLKVGDGGDGGDLGEGHGGDGGALDLLNGKPPRHLKVPVSGGDGNVVSLLDRETPGPADSGGTGSLITVLTGALGGESKAQAVAFNVQRATADDEGGEGGLLTILQSGKGAEKGEYSGGDGGALRALETTRKSGHKDGSGGDGGLSNILNKPPKNSVVTSGDPTPVTKTDQADVDVERALAQDAPQGGSGGEGGVANVGNGGDARGEAVANGGDGKVAGVSSGGDDFEQSKGNGGDGTVLDAGKGGDDKGAQQGNGGTGDVASVGNGGAGDRGKNVGGDGGGVRVGEEAQAAKPNADGARVARPHRSVDGAGSPLVGAGKGGHAKGTGNGEGGAGSVVEAGNGADAGSGIGGDGEGTVAKVGTGGDDARTANGQATGGGDEVRTAKGKHKKGPKHAAEKRGGLINLGGGGDSSGDGRGDGGAGSVARAGNGGKGEIDQGAARGGAHRTDEQESPAGGLLNAGQGGNTANDADGGRGSILRTGNAGDGRTDRGRHRQGSHQQEPDKRGAGRPVDERGALIALFNGAKDRKRHLIDLGNGGAPLIGLANGGRGDGDDAAAPDAPGVAVGNGGPGGNAGPAGSSERRRHSKKGPKRGSYAGGMLIEAFNGADAEGARSRGDEESPVISLANGGRGSEAEDVESSNDRKLGRNPGLLDVGNGGDTGRTGGPADSELGVLLSAFNGGAGGGRDGGGGSGSVARAGDGGSGTAGANGSGGKGGHGSLISTSNGGDGGYGGGHRGQDGGSGAIVKLADGGRGGNGEGRGDGGIGGKGGLLNLFNGGDGGRGTQDGDGGAGGDAVLGSVGNGGKGFGKVSRDGGDAGVISIVDGGDAGGISMEDEGENGGFEIGQSSSKKRIERETPNNRRGGQDVLPKTGASGAAAAGAIGLGLLLGGALLRRRPMEQD